jgi:Glycosyltransferase family 9 (heptosyltransferase)
LKLETALKSLDRYLWRPCAIAGKLVSLFPGVTEERTAILRPGGMGDLIMLCVAAEQLGLDPKSFFWIIEKRSALWARHLGLDYLCYDTASGIPFAFRGRFRTVVNSEQYFGLSQALALAIRAPRGKLVGFDTNRSSRMNDISVPYDHLNSHESVEFAKILGWAVGRKRELIPLPVRIRTRPRGDNLVVGLAGLQVESRRFTPAQWIEMVKLWARDRPFVVVAAPQDLEFAQGLCGQFGSQSSLFHGGFSQMCAMLSEAEAVFTVDGGFLHIASYYGVPATVVFTSGVDRKWAPLAEHSVIVKREDLQCQPCTRFGQVPPCTYQYACKSLNVLQISRPVPTPARVAH